MIQSPVRALWHSPQAMDRLTLAIGVVSTLALLALSLWWLANRPVFVIKRVLVDPMHGQIAHVTHAQIESALIETVSGTALSTDIKAIHQAVMSIPWVRHASVRRVWPNRLLIRIEEHHAVAVWGTNRFLNQAGEVFVAPLAQHREPCALIIATGPPGSEKLVLKRARELQDWLSPLKLPVQSITLSEQYAWTVTLGGGMVMELGRDTLPTPVGERVQMFVKSQPSLVRQMGAESAVAQIARADLRYPTGYAYRTAARPIEAPPEQPPLCIGLHS
jgi:cell division protein FtsQ